MFDAGRQLLQRGDHAVTQASVELVIAGKNVQFFRKLRLFELEPGGSHLYTQPFGFSTPGNNAAIVVTENDDRFSAQIRPENPLATGVEGVDVGQGEVRVHRLQGRPWRQKQAFYRKFTLNFRDNNIPVPRLFCFIHDHQIAGIEANISH